jgi:hypothetical protein
MEATLEKQQKTNSPKLICIITGKVRPTNEKYLAEKAESRGVGMDQFIQYYACKQAVKRLRAGMSVEQVRQELDSEVTTPVLDETVQSILRLNGKTKGQ